MTWLSTLIVLVLSFLNPQLTYPTQLSEFLNLSAQLFNFSSTEQNLHFSDSYQVFEMEISTAKIKSALTALGATDTEHVLPDAAIIGEIDVPGRESPFAS